MNGNAKRCPTCTERRENAAPPSPYQTAAWRANSRDFIRNKFDTCIVRPSYVLLMGDAELDHRARRKHHLPGGRYRPALRGRDRRACSLEPLAADLADFALELQGQRAHGGPALRALFLSAAVFSAFHLDPVGLAARVELAAREHDQDQVLVEAEQLTHLLARTREALELAVEGQGQVGGGLGAAGGPVGPVAERVARMVAA